MPPPALDPNGPDLTVDEVCQVLKLSRRTIYRYCQDGVLKGCWKTEEAWRIPQAAIIAYRDRDAEPN